MVTVAFANICLGAILEGESVSSCYFSAQGALESFQLMSSPPGWYPTFAGNKWRWRFGRWYTCGQGRRYVLDWCGVCVCVSMLVSLTVRRSHVPFSGSEWSDTEVAFHTVQGASWTNLMPWHVEFDSCGCCAFVSIWPDSLPMKWRSWCSPIQRCYCLVP